MPGKSHSEIASGDVLSGPVGGLRIRSCAGVQGVPIARTPLLRNRFEGLRVGALRSVFGQCSAQPFGLRLEGGA